MATLANIRDEYKVALQDLGAQLENINSPATTEVRDKAIAQAVSWYTRRISRIVTALVVNGSTGYYAVPSDYKPFSRVVSIEFPLDQSPPAYLNRKNYQIHRKEGDVLQFYISPNPSGNFRLTYTASHASDLTTIDPAHEPLVGKMAAAIAALEFAARYANSVSNNVDAVNYRTKEQEWRSVAEAIQKKVDEEIRRSEWANVYSSDVETLVKSWRI